MKQYLFTLAMLGLFGTGVASQPEKPAEGVKEKAARDQIATLTRAIDLFALNNDRYPHSLDELLMRKPPYVDAKLLVDPWGNRYLYNPSGDRNEGDRPDVWAKAPKELILGNWENRPKLDLTKQKDRLDLIAARGQVALLSKAAEAFTLKNGAVPDRLEDLIECKPPLLAKEVLLDPWGQKFLYDKSGEKNKGERPDIWTRSPRDDSIGNWELKHPINLVKVQYEVNVQTAQGQVEMLTKAAKAYALKHGKFPPTLAELSEGKTPAVPKAALTDPWGKLYQYDPDGPHNEGKHPDIWTETPQRAQVGNWPKAKS